MKRWNPPANHRPRCVLNCYSFKLEPFWTQLRWVARSRSVKPSSYGQVCFKYLGPGHNEDQGLQFVHRISQISHTLVLKHRTTFELLALGPESNSRSFWISKPFQWTSLSQPYHPLVPMPLPWYLVWKCMNGSAMGSCEYYYSYAMMDPPAPTWSFVRVTILSTSPTNIAICPR